VVVPESVSEGRSYLERLGVPFTQVVHGSLSSLHVSGTPTAMLIDSRGEIKNFWPGKLDSTQEQDLMSSLR
jgi:hypothetical protein